MKPRVERQMWIDVATRTPEPRWHVFFEDGCGCEEEEQFTSFRRALSFANHMASGGSRWEFV